jgi:hypothetical protein
MEEVRENWMQLMRDVGKLYERAEQELHVADADLKRIIAKKQVEAEAQHGCKTAVSQQRFADNDDEVYKGRLRIGSLKGRIQFLKCEIKAVDIGFETWRTDQVSRREEMKAYGVTK